MIDKSPSFGGILFPKIKSISIKQVFQEVKGLLSLSACFAEFVNHIRGILAVRA